MGVRPFLLTVFQGGYIMSIKKTDSRIRQANMKAPEPAPAFQTAAQPTLSMLARRGPYVGGFRIMGLMPSYKPRG
ncbi:MAG: hypothetical protein DI626_11465 [Micavibrio aeruginosavorus]|uniref:Uncharacterized protein n=1 Tax=Micavibrio aeruginosavorus TaxID=349221 RepID=A0A2W4ZC06_9BACT|nr:MAG: hypothetical protein DI626_11465 [Micavibrio aeruginosavorus]